MVSVGIFSLFLSYTNSLSKGLAKLGNIVAETLLLTQMFPSLAARETYVTETNLLLENKKMFLPEVKNTFVSQKQVLRPKHMFPSLATQGNIRSNNVSATMKIH